MTSLQSTFISNAPIPSVPSFHPSSGISVLYQQQRISSLSTSLSVKHILTKYNIPSIMTAQPILLLLPIISICIFNFGMLILIRVLFPTILTHPWKAPDKRERKRDKETTVVFAGSFNPPHWGHLVMIRYLAERYGSVICCIGFNPSKQYDVTAQQRADILKGMVSNISLNNVRVDVVSGYIWRHALAQNAKLFFRGIRTWAEDGADELKLLIQNTYGPLLLGRVWPIDTVFLEGDPRYRGASSTLVRGLCVRIKRNEDQDGAMEELKELVPESVLDQIVEVYGT